MASGGPRAIITHSQRVCRLYKKALKTTFDYCLHRHIFRYEAVLMRARFDATRNETDMRKLAAMLEAGEEEVFQKQSVDPFIYKNDENGITFDRQAHHSDELLDYWHPWERANYLDYFAKRQQMKDGYKEYFEKSLGKKFSGTKCSAEWPCISPQVADLK